MNEELHLATSGLDNLDNEECPEFVPTKHELFVLAKYWIRRRLETESRDFYLDQDSFHDGPLGSFIDRINQMEGILGAKLEEAYDKVYTEFASEVGPEMWDYFFNNT